MAPNHWLFPDNPNLWCICVNPHYSCSKSLFFFVVVVFLSVACWNNFQFLIMLYCTIYVSFVIYHMALQYGDVLGVCQPYFCARSVYIRVQVRAKQSSQVREDMTMKTHIFAMEIWIHVLYLFSFLWNLYDWMLFFSSIECRSVIITINDNDSIIIITKSIYFTSY